MNKLCYYCFVTCLHKAAAYTMLAAFILTFFIYYYLVLGARRSLRVVEGASDNGGQFRAIDNNKNRNDSECPPQIQQG